MTVELTIRTQYLDIKETQCSAIERTKGTMLLLSPLIKRDTFEVRKLFITSGGTIGCEGNLLELEISNGFPVPSVDREARPPA